jgi:hypothetical protein
MIEKEYVCITSSWRVVGNPSGSGLALEVDRGINCEFHCQVVSAHATNTPEKEDVEKAVEELRPALVKAIEAFVEFMHALGDAWAFKETIGLLFQRRLLDTVLERAEENYYKRLESSHA